MTVDPRDPAANATTIRPARTRSGTVVAFDGDVGLGEIRGVDDRRYQFQSVEIADGSRQIDIGTVVTFEPLPRYGRWQAGRVTVGGSR